MGETGGDARLFRRHEQWRLLGIPQGSIDVLLVNTDHLRDRVLRELADALRGDLFSEKHDVFAQLLTTSSGAIGQG